MIFLQVFLAILAAFFVMRLVFFSRMRHHARRGWRGHAGPRHLLRLYWELGLTRPQRQEIRKIFHELRDAVGDLRGDLPHELGQLMSGDVFDRTGAERLTDDRLARLAELKMALLAALERVHALLTPEQRARFATL
jgi:Spy/CpxP family protein refolding chaperone